MNGILGPLFVLEDLRFQLANPAQSDGRQGDFVTGWPFLKNTYQSKDPLSYDKKVMIS